MNRWILGIVVVALAVGASRRARAAAPITGDLERNWGSTPPALRELLLRAEAAARIPGAARFLAVASWRESRWHADAHNQRDSEVAASRSAYESRRGELPQLAHGEEGADFGSGGLFGLLAPYFLWSGVPEVGDDAPLLGKRPTAMFDPATSAFAAAVYMQRLLAPHYHPDDWADVRAGWASPSLLTSARGGTTYNEVRARFLADAAEVGIDLDDPATMPHPSASDWPGVLEVYRALVGNAVA